jgi:hypothetical protein
MKAATLITTLLASAVVLASTAVVNGQYRATGDDGITASPKTRAQMVPRANGISAPGAKVMACPTCKDEFVKSADWTGKGAVKPTLIVAKHLCTGCETSITVTGTGKGKHDRVNHKCSLARPLKDNCCLVVGSR